MGERLTQNRASGLGSLPCTAMHPLISPGLEPGPPCFHVGIFDGRLVGAIGSRVQVDLPYPVIHRNRVVASLPVPTFLGYNAVNILNEFEIEQV